jgi:hypothetical protein
MEEKITQRIAELLAERDAFIANANATIRAYAAAISELERLIAAPPEAAANEP